MTSSEIRQAYLDFMKTKGHHIVDSAPMVVKNDPTLMFTNAGMNQFKDLFLGNAAIRYSRIANSQKCLRVSGKHNDLEEVGVDTYHHTMFEMLGNWSFGDYFKKEAIEWAWELLTKVYGLKPEQLYVTIFGGDAEDGLAEDTEAKDIWSKIVPMERIIACDKKDNFWEMGDTGPCGPCSEIHIDLRSNEERKKLDGATLVNKDDPRVMEIWNLVFMEFNRKADGSLNSLPAKHIDTGMGFERITAALQGKTSNYDTDIFQPSIQALEKRTGKAYSGSDEKSDVAMRVIADHLRAVSFSIADGQLPSNTGAGYVIRRILRRAIRYAYSFLDQREPFIYELVGVLVAEMGGHFKELAAQEDLITRVVKEEEGSFLRTLSKGIDRLETITSDSKGMVQGDKIFELYDTFGFPVDLTALILREKGLDMDEEGFKAHLEQQKARSREDAASATGDWEVLMEDEVEEFVGYDRLESEVNVTRCRKVEQKGKEIYQLVLDHTPFYPEGGGQVGDSGSLIFDGGEEVRIFDTKKENNLILHFTKNLPKNIRTAAVAKVDIPKRRATERNHSVTHLLHKALREILGSHVQQKGSLVHPDYLRFDFAHFSKVESEQLREVEVRVNELIRQDDALDENRNAPIKEAMEQGAMALFGEKYGDVVRTIRFGESVELCGGTHVSSTGKIGWFKITSEAAVASGIRRIEARTASKAMEAIYSDLDILSELRGSLNNSSDPLKAINDLLEERQAMGKQLESMEAEKLKSLFTDLLKEVEELDGIKTLIKEVDVDGKGLKDLIFRLKDSDPKLICVLASSKGEKVNLAIGIGAELLKAKKWNAGALISDWAKEIDGGGGGQAFYASAGGKKAAGIPTALSKAREFIKSS